MLCGYEGGAMTRAVRSRSIVKSLLKTWKDETGCKHLKRPRLLADSDVPSKPFSQVNLYEFNAFVRSLC